MESQHEDRRLGVILVAVVAGYSRFMPADEGETLGQLLAHWTDVVEHIGAKKRSVPITEANFLWRTASWG